jgi:phosphoribosyl-AMP cyclohydrolase
MRWRKRHAVKKQCTGRVRVKKLWHKGEESGHVQTVHEIRLDCDADVIVLQVEQQGGIACHTGRESCFYRVLKDGEWQTVDAVLKDPAQIYGA